MTATTTATGVERAELAGLLLDRSGLGLRRGVDRDQVLAVLAKILDRYRPPDTAHGRLVVNAMLPRSGDRPAEELAVRRVVAGGRAPTPRAVQGELAQLEERRQAWQARLDRLRPTAEDLGPRAAAAVEDLWRRRGKAPGPMLLGVWLGWSKADVWPLVRLLVEAGWLDAKDWRLSPGPRAHGRGR